MPWVSRACGVLAAVSIGLGGQSALAQVDEGDFVHWAYSAFFGTGWYSLGEEESVFAMSYGPRWGLRDASLNEDGERSIGIELRMLLSGSLHEFDLSNIPGITDIDNVSTLSAVPGIEVEIPITTHWSLKPVTYLGWGTALGGGSSSWIYWVGLKSRYELPSGSLNWALINTLYYIGYTPDTGSSGAITPLMTGLEIQHRFGDTTLGGDPLYLRWHAAYTRYYDFEFSDEVVEVLGRTRTDVTDEWELGVALYKADRPLQLWFLKWDQIGVAYRFNVAHDIEAFNITFRALFDR